MNISEKRNQIKEWSNCSRLYFKQIETVGHLSEKLRIIYETIFIDRIQPTRGFFIAKPLDYVIPTNWSNEDPCIVTIYRNASVDALSDYIVNRGTKDDVREFHCPHFNSDTPCTHECKYRATNNEFFETSKMAERAEQELNEIGNARQSAWKRIFSRNK